MKLKFHHENIRVAAAAVAAAQDTLAAVLDAATEASPVVIGERIAGITARHGIPCSLIVEEIDVEIETGAISFRAGGRRLRPDGTASKIEACAYFTIPLNSEAKVA